MNAFAPGFWALLMMVAAGVLGCGGNSCDVECTTFGFTITEAATGKGICNATVVLSLSDGGTDTLHASSDPGDCGHVVLNDDSRPSVKVRASAPGFQTTVQEVDIVPSGCCSVASPDTIALSPQ